MKKKDVQVGGLYRVKVGRKIVDVRLERESPYGGWDARSLATGRRIRIRTAQRLRAAVKRDDVVPAAQRQADAEAGNPGTTEYAAEYENPDVCATPGCEQESVVTYIGRPLCQACWQAESHEPNDEEPDMATKKKRTKKTTSKAKATKPADATPEPEVNPTVEVITGQPIPNTKPAKEPRAKRVSALDAAAEVLKSAGQPMKSREMVTAMAEQGLWSSPGGKTPHATLYAAITREINAKGDQARFRKVERGQFEYAG